MKYYIKNTWYNNQPSCCGFVGNPTYIDHWDIPYVKQKDFHATFKFSLCAARHIRSIFLSEELHESDLQESKIINIKEFNG